VNHSKDALIILMIVCSAVLSFFAIMIFIEEKLGWTKEIYTGSIV
jgi:hypothetical protein